MCEDNQSNSQRQQRMPPLPHAPESGAAASPTERFQNWHILAGVLTATFIAYARTLSFEFVHDDFLQLVNNPAVHSWRYLREYFTANVWAEVYPGIQGNYYRPIFMVWCRLNDALFANQAGMWHLTTVLTHLVATALVYYLLLRLVHDQLSAGLGALIFGVHPAHIEAVAWVSAVTEPLVAIFFIAAFICYLRWRKGKHGARGWLALGLFLYAMGMLEKETAVILPAIMLVHEWLYGAHPAGDSFFRRAWRSVWPTLPFFLLTIPYLVARVLALHGFSHIYTPIPLVWVVFTWPSLLWFWVKHLAVPLGLASNYELRNVIRPGWSNFILPCAGMAATLAGLAWGARKSREIAFAGAWIFLPLAPLLDIRVLPQDDFAHDRYLYLPSVGLAILAALAIRHICSARSRRRASSRLPVVVTVLVAAGLGISTWTQSFYFENNWVYYRYNYLFAPSNAYAENNYGVILARLGMRDEAIKVLREGNARNPGYWSLAYNLGCNYYKAQQYQAAEQYLLEAIQIDPTRPGAYFCLGLTHLDAGNPRLAEWAFRAALKLKPNGESYHYDLGVALKEQGNLQGALRQFQADKVGSPSYRDSTLQIQALLQKPSSAAPPISPAGEKSTQKHN